MLPVHPLKYLDDNPYVLSTLFVEAPEDIGDVRHNHNDDHTAPNGHKSWLFLGDFLGVFGFLSDPVFFESSCML